MSSYLQQFNFQIFGESGRPKLVFLHGLMGSLRNWRTVIQGIEQEFQILVYDQRGHGRSLKPDTGYSPEDYAKDLAEITNELGWEKFYLVGHSMGGRNALAFSIKHGQRVLKLVIEDIGPDARPGVLNSYQALLDAIPTPFSSKRAAKEFFLNEFQNVPWDRDPKDLLGSFLYTNIVETVDGKADWVFSRSGILESVRFGRNKDSWEEWKSLTVPTLLVRGQNSNELSQETFQKMLDVQTGAKGVIIPNAGHWVHYDQPVLFQQKLLDFLR